MACTAAGLPLQTAASCRCACSRGFLSYADLPEAERYLASDYRECGTLWAAYNAVADSSSPRSGSGNGRRSRDTSSSYLTRMCLNDTLAFLPEHNLTTATRRRWHERPRHGRRCKQGRCNGDVSASRGLRIRKGVQKYLLKKIGESIYPVKWCIGPRSPSTAPCDQWIAGPSGMVDCLLSEGQIRDRGIYDPKIVKRYDWGGPAAAGKITACGYGPCSRWRSCIVHSSTARDRADYTVSR